MLPKNHEQLIVYEFQKVTPKGEGQYEMLQFFFSQGYPHQKVRMSQEIPGWDRHMIFL